MSCLIRLVSAVCALSQSQSCLESWDLYLSMAALSVIKGFSFDSHSSFHLDENTIKIKHCILASSATCEIIRSHYLASEIRAPEMEDCGHIHATHLSLEFISWVPPHHETTTRSLAQLNKSFCN